MIEVLLALLVLMLCLAGAAPVILAVTRSWKATQATARQEVEVLAVLARMRALDARILAEQHQEWSRAFLLAAGHEWNQEELNRKAQAAAAAHARTQARVDRYAAGGYISGYGHPVGPGSSVQLWPGESLPHCLCDWCSAQRRPGKYIG